MAGKPASGGRTQILVALIGLTGVLSAALIANWDKVFADKAPAPTVTQSEQARAASSRGAVESGATAVNAQMSAVSRVADASTGVLDDIADQIESAADQGASAPAANITGAWRDTDGFAYLIEQQDAAFRYGQFANGVAVGGGEGHIQGRLLNYRFSGAGGQGTCSAQVAADGGSIAGTCRMGAESWPFHVTR